MPLPPPPSSPALVQATPHYLLGVDLEELVDWRALIVPIKLQPQDRLLLLGGCVVPGQLLETQAQQDVLASGRGRAWTPGQKSAPLPDLAQHHQEGTPGCLIPRLNLNSCVGFSKERSPCFHQTLEGGRGPGRLRCRNPQYFSPAGRARQLV